MVKTIFVNSTFATTGGVKTILDDFIDTVKTINITDTEFIFFVPESYQQSVITQDNIKIVKIDAKSWHKRLLWDFIGLKLWSIKNKIRATTIFSLQNTSVNYYKNSKQIVYIQQPIPFEENINWSFFKREERKLWFYKRFYLNFIKMFLSKDNTIIVQTDWMKRAAAKKLKKINYENIHIIKPAVKELNTELNREYIFDNNYYNIFYPAMAYVYKNHMVLVQALKIIREKYKKYYEKLRIYFTLGNSSDYEKKILDKVREWNLEDKIIFMGKVPYDMVLNGYSSCNLVVFPSYIETFGLPLVEAAQYGNPIIASDREFSREVIGNYKGVNFVDYDSPAQWAEAIVESRIKHKKYDSYFVKYETNWKDLIQLLL
ncbi:glycosyltransferase [Clostridium pasteurianum]|uniref:glycosyltransferase n=1 Tax=Clostridium pasteurianum TaxID=1501 RepID=UPI002260AB31|nr:glycosyltransferase [Clostridium pasteurianum]UZW14945.1 glycosyltransferase [Clostridium pasteurianum]